MALLTIKPVFKFSKPCWGVNLPIFFAAFLFKPSEVGGPEPPLFVSLVVTGRAPRLRHRSTAPDRVCGSLNDGPQDVGAASRTTRSGTRPTPYHWLLSFSNPRILCRQHSPIGDLVGQAKDCRLP